MDLYEEERWEKEGPASTHEGWSSHLIYSITDKGTYTRMILIDPNGKKFFYRWRRSAIKPEVLEARGFVVTKRRKPKKLSIK